MRRDSNHLGNQHRFGREREGSRSYDDGQGLSFTTVLTSSEIQIPLSNTTLALRGGLRRVGVDRPMVLNYAGIYEMALMDLARRFERSSLGEDLRQDALAEILLLSNALEGLFTGRIKIRHIPNQWDDRMYTGYFEQNGKKRLLVYSRIGDTFLAKEQKWAKRTVQVKVKEIKDVTNRGRAVAGSDGEWRVGLGHSGGLNKWQVTVAAGYRRSTDSPWLSIFPLSQAISALKKNRELPLEKGADPYKFYFTPGPMTDLDDPGQSNFRFNELNGYMRLILDGLDTGQQV